MRAHSIAGGARGDPRLSGAVAQRDDGRPRARSRCRWPGAAPRRQAGNTSQGRIPAPGWLAVNDWQGMRGFDENPWVVDPAERHRGQHQQPHHRRGLPRPPELRLGRRLPHHPGGQAARRPAVSHAGQLHRDPDRHRLGGGAGAAAADRARPLVLRRAGGRGHAGAAAAGGAGAARGLERRDERAYARSR